MVIQQKYLGFVLWRQSAAENGEAMAAGSVLPDQNWIISEDRRIRQLFL